MELDGTVAIVTGAGYGIGRATAAALAKNGAHVVVADIAEAAGETAVEQIIAGGADAIFVKTDVAARESVEALIDACVQWRGHCDLFISNAAIAGVGAPH